ncbi:MAG: co-chaperone GroES [Bdellovibrionaceae bacterium]|nr:co-chaperone GroES [Pseudobdellovibrionaceae bacterium]MDW8190205.1 co-chaperone GroES [Pseudobdellovibrionaceae bacterium]
MVTVKKKKKTKSQKTVTQKKALKNKKTLGSKAKGLSASKQTPQSKKKSGVTSSRTQSNKTQAKGSISGGIGQISKEKQPSLLQVTPIHDQVFIRILSEERVSPSGLIIPDTARQEAGLLRGEVLSVGPGKRDKKGRIRPTELKVGDRVLVNTWSGQSFEYGNQKYLIVRESDVLGVSL